MTVRENQLSIRCDSWYEDPRVLLPTSLYTCKSLATLILDGKSVFDDISVYDDIGELLKSVTSVKRLSLCPSLFQGEVILLFPSNDSTRIPSSSLVISAYPAGTIFNQLEHLELDINYYDWKDLLVNLLQDSPKLLS
ncbi:unnamed protein product [Microthlaspi erraticum]|uniref:FBD domain-containing protein n=1 Tax=Microthlaspi erraticum TaxID=1685480 RepID=A0A6D2IU54_9BRAS|nr:unnamed protein product [Microthlaspi erraticum]